MMYSNFGVGRLVRTDWPHSLTVLAFSFIVFVQMVISVSFPWLFHSSHMLFVVFPSFSVFHVRDYGFGHLLQAKRNKKPIRLLQMKCNAFTREHPASIHQFDEIEQLKRVSYDDVIFLHTLLASHPSVRRIHSLR